VGGVAEGAIESRGVFGCGGQDGDVGEVGAVEAGAQGGDSAVHHAAGGDDARAGFCVVDGLFDEALDSFVVLHRGAVFREWAAVTVVGVFAEAQVGDGDHGNFGGGAEESADDVVFVEGSAACGVFGFAVDDAENEIGF